MARNQALDAQLHNRENPPGIEGVPLSSRSLNFDSSDIEQTQPLHTTGNPDRSYAQPLFGAAGPSGASTHPAATFQNDGLTIVVFPVPAGEARRNGKSPHPTGCTSFSPTVAEAKRRRRALAARTCMMQADDGVEGPRRKRSEASFRLGTRD